MSAVPEGFPSRAERRRRTEERILVAARELFAELGYERTTIRAVASAAGVDPALVMHYHVSKEELFARAVARAAPDEPVATDPAELAEQLLAGLRTRLESEPVASLALLRSMLTHPEAAAGAHTAIDRELARVAGAIEAGGITAGGAALRASIVNVITLGVVLGRYQLDLGGLRDAPPEDIIALLRPCFHAILGGSARA